MSLAEVEQAVSSIQMWLDDPPGEAVVRQCVVLRLLQAAGFDIWNPAEVVPEETNATGSRADFLIRRGEGKFALEIKGMGVTVGPKEYQQAATYAVNEGSRWAIVTNGRVWVVIDEHLPGKWEDRVALKVEMGQGDSFATDFFSLLNAEVWAANAFADAVETVRLRQQQRRDEARIRREKRPVVEQTQAEFEIATFGKAAEAAVKMGRITEGERDVLLGVERAVDEQEIELSYAIAGASARVIYHRKAGTWTIKAGSTAANRLMADGTTVQGVGKRRKNFLAKGILREISPKLLEYVQDCVYSSASLAAADIAGASRNGWDVWKDAEGRPAQHYRPK
ncbi:Restriction endonuclease, type I [Deinococcus proteolyticus MRP]|uniref:Restriction endonuclease, type I n=1 Tax=Deinococcus proteolyticus (strain ATCC 35074 / DSM 20540 / JCM 6276 / NBRC 101906 / NCIMB 13154 / VKM Ac-1939 / CCM 2703 / MRP) TaxID=693977 RepID=F0RKF8_DEIPM|nr:MULTISPECIES: DUF4357 domain-containing protein [Deinococcus]ADY26737.1 Restriction endonuclease, type I [Deinococcus proteolyticus MRP]MCY1702866.1 DUF4357 domain-containing protein [Deinococcus sp. SL84]